jgi:hypothetical protein
VAKITVAPSLSLARLVHSFAQIGVCSGSNEAVPAFSSGIAMVCGTKGKREETAVIELVKMLKFDWTAAMYHGTNVWLMIGHVRKTADDDNIKEDFVGTHIKPSIKSPNFHTFKSCFVVS